MGPMETTTQALNLEQTSVQGLKPEGHHPRFESWPMALKIPGLGVGRSPELRQTDPSSGLDTGCRAGLEPQHQDLRNEQTYNPCRTQAWVLQGSLRPLAKIQTLYDGLQASNLERMSVQGSKPG
ncbi:hypothetical protein PGTUg99_033349 [Puccinia graminis f. sp. tritici]|uniref:Uncharacterized protein n=1 Tax=Puccinia graminis f. sp. tritici TaxID=56615 RepID=A0A5B0S9T8_PUCGR|nr:hypothetical protein PGTUg99_033349 [Puccinia graminis f. sp. tritici]